MICQQETLFHSLLFSVLTTYLQYVVITYITHLLMDDTYLSPICIGSLPLCKAGVEVGGFSTHPRASTYQEANKCLTNLRAIYIDSNHLYYQLTIVTQVV
jgi:hypothetical protein